MDDHGEPTGSLALDGMKATLRKGVDGLTNQQVHLEGCKIAKKVIADLEKEGERLSFVRDEMVDTIQDMQAMIDQAKATHKPLVVVDVDAPLMVSCLRVLQRDIQTEPCIPLAPIEKGYTNTKGTRAMMMQLIQFTPEVESYELWVTDPKGKNGLAARKTKEGIEIIDRHLFAFALDKETIGKEVAEVRKAVITQELLESYSRFGIKPERLKPYIGMKIEDALLAHSLELPQWG